VEILKWVKASFIDPGHVRPLVVSPLVVT